MAGSIKAVPGKKGMWIVRYEGIDTATGKRRQYKRKFTGSKPQANRFLVEQLSTIISGLETDLGQITLKEYLNRWVEEYCKPNLAWATCDSYSRTIRKHILPKIGEIKLSNLKPAHIQSYYQYLGKPKNENGGGLSGTSILYHHRIIKEALKHAENLGYITKNPANMVKPPRKNKPEMKTLSQEQSQYVLSYYKDHRIYLALSIAIKTGMRQGEICGLRWQNVDLRNGIISVTHSLQRQGKNLVLKEPKTKKSRRSIPLPNDLLIEMKKTEMKCRQERLAYGGAYDGRGFVCSWEDGRPFEPDWVSKQWRLIIEHDRKRSEEEKTERKIPDGVRFHDLRHTHATLLLSQGVNIKVVQERLGHESISTTGDIYAHVNPTMQQEAVRALNNIFRI